MYAHPSADLADLGGGRNLESRKNHHRNGVIFYGTGVRVRE